MGTMPEVTRGGGGGLLETKKAVAVILVQTSTRLCNLRPDHT